MTTSTTSASIETNVLVSWGYGNGRATRIASVDKAPSRWIIQHKNLEGWRTVYCAKSMGDLLTLLPGKAAEIMNAFAGSPVARKAAP